MTSSSISPLARPDAPLGDPLDRRLLQVDEVHVRPVERLVVAGLHRDALVAEAVVLGDQLLGDDRVVDPCADLVGDELGQLVVGRLVHERLAEVRQPDAEAGFAVELLPLGQALLAGHLVERSPIGLVDEPARRARADGEDLVVALLDVGHLLGADRPVVQRRAPVGPALEHRQLADLIGQRADDLHAGGAGADDADAQSGQVAGVVGPVVGVERTAAEVVHALVARPASARTGCRSP